MIKYLCIVGDIESQADQAGLELFSAQSARVVLGCGRPVPGEASGATGHAATHTAVSVKVRGVGDWTGSEGEVGEVVLVGGMRVGVHHAQEGKGGEGVKGEGHAQEIENREHSAYSLGSGR